MVNLTDTLVKYPNKESMVAGIEPTAPHLGGNLAYQLSLDHWHGLGPS